MLSPISLLRLAAACLVFFTIASTAAAQSGEYIILSGGPALRRWEDLRRAGEQHDRWWGNFVRPARVTIEALQKRLPPGTAITWLVYRDAYVRRTAEDRQPLVSFVESVRDKFKVRLVWYQSGNDVINYINRGMNRGRTKIVGFEFFGHSNKFCFMFDYSSDLYGVSSAWLHEVDLPKLRSGAFAKDAYCKSWGCHTAESMAAAWKKATGVKIIGAIGKTDYSDMHLRGWMPGLSSDAHWR